MQNYLLNCCDKTYATINNKASNVVFNISFDSNQTLTGQWIAYSEDRSVVGQGDLNGEREITVNPSSSIQYVEFDAHKAGGGGSENAFYVQGEVKVMTNFMARNKVINYLGGMVTIGYPVVHIMITYMVGVVMIDCTGDWGMIC